MQIEQTEEEAEEGWEAEKAKAELRQDEEVVEELDEEAEEEGLAPIKKAKSKKTEIKPDNKKQVTTYSAYQVPERMGVLNNKTGKPVGENVLELLALVLTKLERIEEGVYGN